MQQAAIYRNGQLAGILTRHDAGGYEFRYDDEWFNNTALPAISLTLPKNQQLYVSPYLFPCFFNMLSEGVNRKLQARHFKIDETNYFALLLATAQNDTIGAITIKPIHYL